MLYSLLDNQAGVKKNPSCVVIVLAEHKFGKKNHVGLPVIGIYRNGINIKRTSLYF